MQSYIFCLILKFNFRCPLYFRSGQPGKISFNKFSLKNSTHFPLLDFQFISGTYVNVMEDKKLKINQPIPSVRRLFYYNKDQSLGNDKSTHNTVEYNPIRNQVRVPFTWEQSPGRPKSTDPSENHDYIEDVPEVRKEDFDEEFTACVRAGDGYRMDARDLRMDQLTLTDWVLPVDQENDNENCMYQDETRRMPYFRQNDNEQESDGVCRKSPVKMCGIFRFSNPAPVRNRQSHLYSKQHISNHGDNGGDSGKVSDKTTYVDVTENAKSSLAKNDFKNFPRSVRINKPRFIDMDKDTYSYTQHINERDSKNSQKLDNLESKKIERVISFQFSVPPALTVPPANSDQNLPVWSKTTAGDVQMKVKGETRKVHHKLNSMDSEERQMPIQKKTKKPPRSKKDCNSNAFGIRFH